MIKVKRSFLEKLTGAKPIEDANFDRDEQVSQPINTIYKEESEFAMTPSTFERNSREEVPISDGSEGQLTIDVYQTDNDIVIKSTIAGVKPEDLDVSINNDMVTIRGERKNEEQVSEDNYYYQECYWGGFSRSVILPVDIISEKAEASMKNGILTIRLPKADSNKTKKIQVRGF
jgi:HSP20 family protein